MPEIIQMDLNAIVSVLKERLRESTVVEEEEVTKEEEELEGT